MRCVFTLDLSKKYLSSGITRKGNSPMLHHRSLGDAECLRLLETRFNSSCAFLNLSHNQLLLQDEWLLSAILFRGESLLHLDLSHNLIRSIPRFNPVMPSLITLDLSFNHIRHLPTSFFDSTPNLKLLKMQGNELGSLPESFSCLDKLEQLILTQNCLTRLPIQLPTSLIILECGGNRLDTFPFGLMDMKCLARLDLQDNQIRRVPRGNLSRMLALESINLQRNRIETISEGIRWPPQLRVLDISFNRLPYLPEDFKSLSRCILLLTGNPCISQKAAQQYHERLITVPIRLVEAAARQVVDSPHPCDRPLTPPIREYLHVDKIQKCANCPMRFFQPVAKTLVMGTVQGHPETAIQRYVCSARCINCPQRVVETVTDDGQVVLLTAPSLFDL